VRLSERFYRLLVSLYPAGFREAYGGPLRRQFKDEIGEATNLPGLSRLWVRTLFDLARSLPSQIAREAWLDARHTLRLWRLRPLHTCFVLVVLAVAIGVNTGIFSVLNALLLRSLPFHQPERLAAMRMFLPAGMGAHREFHEWRRASPYAADAFSFTSNEVNLEGAAQAARSRLTETSSNFFDVLGVAPAIGRGFAPGEDAPGAEAIAVIGHGLWQQLYGGAASAIGGTIRVNGVPLTIVGVAPPGFDYPRGTSVWSSTVFDYRRIGKSGVSMYSAVLRIADGVTWRQARQAFELEAYAAAPERRTVDPENRPALVPLRDELAGPVRQASLALMVGAALLLLLACANVANLLLSRILAREQELMIRAALGASRARLTQQLLTESLLLSGIAAAAGLAVAWGSVEAAAALQPSPLASQGFSLLDWRVMAFTVLLSVSTGLLFGVSAPQSMCCVARSRCPPGRRPPAVVRPGRRTR
jgi:predicted permease